MFACYQLSHNVALCTKENHSRIINIKATKLLCGCIDHSRTQRDPKHERHRTTMWFHRPQRTTIEPQLNFRTTMCTMLNQNHYVINAVQAGHVDNAIRSHHVANVIQNHYVDNVIQNHIIKRLHKATKLSNVKLFRIINCPIYANKLA